MPTKIFVFCLVFLICCTSGFALSRDIKYIYDSEVVCKKCLQTILKQGCNFGDGCGYDYDYDLENYCSVVDREMLSYLSFIPDRSKKEMCCLCLESTNKCVYYGYFDFKASKYFGFFKRFLALTTENTSCECYWPEISSLAAQINDRAYHLFFKLCENTAFRWISMIGYCHCSWGGGVCCYCPIPESCCLSSEAKIKLKSSVLEPFFKNFRYSFAFDCVRHFAQIMVSHCFFYSDYQSVCQDILEYSYRNLTEKDYLGAAKL